jgi:hypothetical protein
MWAGAGHYYVGWCNGARQQCALLLLLLLQVCEDDATLSVTYNIDSSNSFNLTFNSLCEANPSSNGPCAEQHLVQWPAGSA